MNPWVISSRMKYAGIVPGISSKYRLALLKFDNEMIGMNTDDMLLIIIIVHYLK